MDRLKHRREFLAAARGQKWATDGLVLQSRARADENDPRFGLTVTRKVGNAVVRNRARRRLRAVAQSLLPELGRKGFDYVLIGRAGTLYRPWDALLADFTSAIEHIHKPRSARPPSGTPGSSTAPRQQERPVHGREP
ncbi:MAG: ribonuclease P protein component [Parvibaculaceae bacterium]|nr:ribonuclease P protein component [Parvibaculaceae bacterium]